MFDILLALYRPRLLSKIAEFARYGSGSSPIPPNRLPFPSRPLRGIKIILFDIYGTLLHSRAGEIAVHRLGSLTNEDTLSRRNHIALLVQMIERSRYRARPAEQWAELLSEITQALQGYITEAHKHSVAKGIEFPEIDIRHIWRSFLHNHTVVAKLKREGNRYSYWHIMYIALCYEMLVNPSSEMPGALVTLQALSPFPLGIVSNAQFYTPLLLESLWGRGLKKMGFQPALCSWSYRLGCAKPSVVMFTDPLQALRQRWGIMPSQILFLGNDLLNDMWCARQAGLQCCLFAGDSHSLRLRKNDPRCRNFIPESCIGALSELPALLS